MKGSEFKTQVLSSFTMFNWMVRITRWK